MKYQAILLDMDGTLIDSMWVWQELLCGFLQNHQLQVVPEVVEQIQKMTLPQSSRYVREYYHLSLTPEEILDEWRASVYRAYAEAVPLKHGAKEFLMRCKKNGRKLALVTACDPVLTQVCLNRHGVFALFDTVVYAEEVGAGKEKPDIYQKALTAIGCSAEEAVLFEDILPAVRTGKAMGMFTVAVADAQTEREIIESEADLYIRDFTELDTYREKA